MKMHHHPVLHYLILLFALLTLAPLNAHAEQPTSTPDDPIALLKQGIAYCQGDGVKKDEAKGAELIGGAIGKGVKKLAAQGNAEAQYSLGTCYFWGFGVDEDEVEAIKWYRKAAEQGHAEARRMLGQSCYELGKRYLEGIGVEKDAAQAVEWFKKAADAGNESAMYELGKCYLEGTGVDKDAAQAKQWLRKAADESYDAAKELLQELE